MSSGPIKITIPGAPHAQARQRMRMVRTKDGRTFAQNYQPKESRNWKATAQAHMAATMGDRLPFSGPVELLVVAYFTCPRSDWRKREPRPQRWHIKKPDLDNCLKALKDAAKGVLWFDDSQVSSVCARKVTAAQGARPHVELSIRELEESANSGDLFVSENQKRH